MSNFSAVDEKSFETEVVQASKPVFVEFGATWCAPCKMLEPVLIQYAQELGDKARLVKVDVDQSPELTERFGVMGVPTLILFKGGQPVERNTGYIPKNKIIERYGKHLE